MPIILYLGAIFWTLGFDTIYGYQDIKDDEIIGLKSTSIKFKNNPKKFISLCYIILIISLLTLGYLMEFNFIYFISIGITSCYLFINQIKNLDISNPLNCLKKFKSNNFFGLIVLVNIIIGKIF